MYFYITAVTNRRNITPVILTIILLPGETCADGKVNVNWKRIAVAFRIILIDLDELIFECNSNLRGFSIATIYRNIAKL